MREHEESTKNHGPKLLHLARILNEETDDGHGITMEEILTRLNLCGIMVKKRTIWSDIKILNEFAESIGSQAEIQRYGSPRTSTYGYSSHYFTDEELMLIHSAIDSSKFLTRKKRDEALAKIDAFASKRRQGQLDKLISASNGVHMSNEKIYYWLSATAEAVAEKRKIAITYKHYSLEAGSEKPVANGSAFTLDPLGLLYLDGNCYLLALYDRDEHAEMASYDDLRIFRVDRIESLELLDKPAYSDKFTRNLDMNELANMSFGAWITPPRHIILKVHKHSVTGVMDRFNFEDGILPASDAENAEFCRVGVDIMPGPPFYGWVAGFGGSIEIEEPAEVRQEYESFIMGALGDRRD